MTDWGGPNVRNTASRPSAASGGPPEDRADARVDDRRDARPMETGGRPPRRRRVVAAVLLLLALAGLVAAFL